MKRLTQKELDALIEAASFRLAGDLEDCDDDVALEAAADKLKDEAARREQRNPRKAMRR